ncbi:MAG: hypothetical protein HFG22_15855 [Lachnospiraceae bacterium]|nr:hypothetical protein [Lachnospiraceae bacterium]
MDIMDTLTSPSPDPHKGYRPPQHQRRRKAASSFLDLTAYLFLPVFSLLFLRGTNWLTTNLSVLGNDSRRQNAFVFWGLFVGIYFFILLTRIAGHLPTPPRGVFFIPLSLLLLTCALTMPYLPEQFPFRSFLHVLFAFLSSLCLALFVALLVFQLYRRQPDRFFLYPVGLSSILSGCILLFLAAGIISSALEIFFVLSLSLLCRRLETRLART